MWLRQNFEMYSFLVFAIFFWCRIHGCDKNINVARKRQIGTIILMVQPKDGSLTSADLMMTVLQDIFSLYQLRRWGCLRPHCPCHFIFCSIFGCCSPGLYWLYVVNNNTRNIYNNFTYSLQECFVHHHRISYNLQRRKKDMSKKFFIFVIVVIVVVVAVVVLFRNVS